MSYPIIYDMDETNFFHLGLGVLKDAISCKVIEERNGAFELEMEYKIGGVGYKNIKNDNIIKVDAGHRLKDQRFRIAKIIEKSDSTIFVYAKHVSHITRDIALPPHFTINSATAQVALNTWRSALVGGDHGLRVTSDITTISRTDLRIGDYENSRQVLGGIRGSILDVWGGEYMFDNEHIHLLSSRGSRANTLIAYGRNLTDLNQEKNIANTVTSIYPYAIIRDGDNEQVFTLPSPYVVDSEHVGAFPNRRTLPVDFSVEFDNEALPTATRLRQLAENYIRNNNVGKPRVSISISFVDLTKALNFSELVQEELNLCDVVPIKFEKLNIDTEAQIIRIEWDVLLDEYDRIEIGESRTTLSDRIRDVERNVNEVSNSANYALTSANGKNTVFFGQFPNPPGPTARRVGDLWYMQNGEFTELRMWDGVTWNFITSTAPDEYLLSRIEEAEKDAERALQDAEDAMVRANEAFDLAEPLLDIECETTGDRMSITAMAQGLRSAVFDQNGRSQITQLSNQIDLKVGNSEIINRINVSTEGIIIAGNRVQITGQTFIESAVITDALVKDLNAINVNTNTLVAGIASVIEMNASRITTGTFDADRIATNSITADHLAANAIQVGFNAVGNVLQLNSTNLTMLEGGVRRAMLTSTGLTYWDGLARELGRFTHNRLQGTDLQGVAINSQFDGDYIHFGFMRNSSGSILGTSMYLDPLGRRPDSDRPGIYMFDQLNLRTMGTRGYTTNTNFEVQMRVVGGADCTYIGTSNGQNGIAFGSNRLFLVQRGAFYEWDVWR